MIQKLLAMGLTFLIGVPSSAIAGTGDKVRDWFNQQNYSNVTEPGVYEGQSARYATLGGISARSPVVYPFRFVQVQTPKFSAGCGGIDFYAGGFSAVNADQFVRNLRAIGQNSSSLAFMLALKIITPQIEGTMEKIQSWANKYLNMNMDSCEAATKLVGGAMDYMGAKESNCTIKRMNDYGEDWTNANYACTTGGSIRSTEGSEPNEVDFIKGNLAWYVLMQDSFFQNDTNFAQLVMNLTGTMIIKDVGSSDDGQSDIRIVEPAISDDSIKDRFENIYTGLLLGSEASSNVAIYKCSSPSSDENGCLHLTSLQDVATNWQGLHSRIQNLVSSIISKIYSDTALTPEERGLVSSSTIPLYRYLAVTAAYFPRGSNVSRLTNDYTQLIAEDILLRSLNAIVSKVEQQSSMLPGGIADSGRIKEYRKDLEKVMNGLSKLRRKNDFDIEKFFTMQQRIQLYEKALMSRLSSGLVMNATWGG